MRSPEGEDYWTTGVYREIAPPSLLVMTNCFADEKGNVVSLEIHGLSPGIAREMVLTVRLQEIDNKKRTRQILTHSGISKMNAEERRDNEPRLAGLSRKNGGSTRKESTTRIH